MMGATEKLFVTGWARIVRVFVREGREIGVGVGLQEMSPSLDASDYGEVGAAGDGVSRGG